MSPDAVTGLFEMGGMGFISLSILRLYKDKVVRGVSWLHVAFFAVWGYWNLYYYPHLDQWWAFVGGIGIVSANTAWLCQLLYYSHKEARAMTRDVLSRNFDRHEFACQGVNCCSHSSPVSLELIEALQALRNIVDAPMVISSGFRCITHNREKESRDTSQHTLGRAADVVTPRGFSIDEFYDVADGIPAFLGIGRYPWGLHLDVRNGIRTRWDKR